KQLGRADQEILAAGPAILADRSVAAAAAGIQNQCRNSAVLPDRVDRYDQSARLNSLNVAALNFGGARFAAMAEDGQQGNHRNEPDHFTHAVPTGVSRSQA